MNARNAMLTGIPHARKRSIETQFRAQGATVRSEQSSNGSWTIHVSLPDRTFAGDMSTCSGAGNPTTAAPDPATHRANAAARTEPPAHRLGRLSARFETGGRGPATVSTDAGDASGVCYGSYQMTSAGGGTVARFIAQSEFPWRMRFVGLAPGSASFTGQWLAIARAEPDRLHRLEHAFMKRTHFDPLVTRVCADEGLDVTVRSRALQNVIWSTAVHHGPNSPVVHRAIQALKQRGAFNTNAATFDRDLIVAVYQERGRRTASGTLLYFARNAPDTQAQILDRFIAEQHEALRMLV